MIVQTAGAVIADRGLVGTTMRDIAQAAAVSPGTVTYHFSGIDEILAEVLQHEMDGFYLPVMERAKAESGAAGLHRLIDDVFAGDERTVRHWRLWLDFWGLAAHDQAHAAWQAKAYDLWRADLRQIIERGLSAGELALPGAGWPRQTGTDQARPDPSGPEAGSGSHLVDRTAGQLEEVMADLLALVDGLAAQAYLPVASIGPAEARRHLHGWVERHLAISIPGPGPGNAPAARHPRKSPSRRRTT